MTPEAAIYQFLNGFGIPAYAASSVPDQESPEWGGFPYISYEPVQPDTFGEANMVVNVWYRTDSEAEPNAKVREIGLAIPPNSKVPVTCDSGGILISRGSPWAQSVIVEGEDSKVKRRMLNVTLEYVLTE